MHNTVNEKSARIRIAAVVLIVLIAGGIFIVKNRTSAQDNSGANRQPNTNLPTLLEFSSTTCAPCREMIPILDELKDEYEGRVNIKVTDIDEQPEEAQKYSIRVIPTQIFLDAEGKELGRHEGYIPKEDLIKLMEEKMGVT
jgi:thioredoxin 1